MSSKHNGFIEDGFTRCNRGAALITETIECACGGGVTVATGTHPVLKDDAIPPVARIAVPGITLISRLPQAATCHSSNIGWLTYSLP